MRFQYFSFLTLALILGSLDPLVAQEAKSYTTSTSKVIATTQTPDPLDSLKRYDMPQIVVLGGKEGLFKEIPGAVSFISARELNLLAPISGNEVFRRAPGLHVVDEEGLGMRVNVGIRGLDPDRSRNVLMLEDGIPVALNPYGEPEMYYTPVMDRMIGVEVLKGSGQIMYGPQTVGGVINYITADPPQNQELNVKLRAGQGGYFSGLVGYGNTIGNVGYQVNYLYKRADDVGLVGFEISDFNTKFKFRTGDKSSVGVKLSLYNEVSNATYIGITQTMYDASDEFDFARLAPDDRLNVRRYAASVTHQWEFSERFSLKTTAFANTTSRNWQRQDFAYAPVPNPTGVVWGDINTPNGAIYMRDQNAHRNRSFEVAGIETQLAGTYYFGNIENRLHIGARAMYERALEQRIDGASASARTGRLRDDEIRTGIAYSLYAQNALHFSERFSVTPGLRAEFYNYERNILLNNNNLVGVRSENNITSLIPGIGANYNLGENTSIFAGAHRGFSPPRVKDAISATGEVFELDAELSWNYELGFRSNISNFAHIEFTGFYMDFENQIIPVSESSGGAGAGLINGGETTHRGIEGAFNIDFGKIANLNHRLVLDLNATYTDAFFNKDRFIGQSLSAGVEGTNISGNRTPYAPQWLLSSAFTWQAPFGFDLRLTATHVGEQFTDVLNTITPSANGRIGKLDAYTIFDATLGYAVKRWNTHFNVSVKNLSDERYIATRRPQGIRVGLPRFITAGVEIRL
ncbi:TonB-dependent receptor family protein [Eisenibacter elegans]|uniref:TonB-dependent receptor family protein n=1 Tax=Eisenibacter elegans TaxID=997 RepID=UPI0004269BEA|nr:TonB-dependent receptor [Eisenibacter elegans]